MFIRDRDAVPALWGDGTRRQHLTALLTAGEEEKEVQHRCGLRFGIRRIVSGFGTGEGTPGLSQVPSLSTPQGLRLLPGGHSSQGNTRGVLLWTTSARRLGGGLPSSASQTCSSRMRAPHLSRVPCGTPTTPVIVYNPQEVQTHE